jgi:hypothetical protein
MLPCVGRGENNIDRSICSCMYRIIKTYSYEDRHEFTNCVCHIQTCVVNEMHIGCVWCTNCVRVCVRVYACVCVCLRGVVKHKSPTTPAKKHDLDLKMAV